MMHPDSQSQSQSDVELFGFENQEQLEQAMLVALRAGERSHLLRLMRRCGPCLHMLRPQLQTYMLESIIGILSTVSNDHDTAVPTVRQILPWLGQAVRCGVVGILPPRVREMLASALLGLANGLPGADSIAAQDLYKHFVTSTSSSPGPGCDGLSGCSSNFNGNSGGLWTPPPTAMF